MSRRMGILGILLILLITTVPAGEASFNRFTVSLGLSGHILLGVGLEHGFDGHHAVRVTVFPVVLPGKGFPFAFSAGYGYYFNGSKWRAGLGGEFALLVSPPDPHKRKFLPLLNLVPAVQYQIDGKQFVDARLWLSYFFGRANVPVAPTAIVFRYGRNL